MRDKKNYHSIELVSIIHQTISILSFSEEVLNRIILSFAKRHGNVHSVTVVVVIGNGLGTLTLAIQLV